MPLSSNAPFNEFGHSMVLRDLEQIYLLLGGKGAGSSGDASTQDQDAGVSQNTGDGGGLPDNSRFVTENTLNRRLTTLAVSYPISISNGGTGQTTALSARRALGVIGETLSSYTTNTSNVAVPAGVSRMRFILIGGGGGAGSANYYRYSLGGGGFLDIYFGAPGGGGGQIVIADINVTPGETFDIVIGAGGTTGNNGSDTTVTFDSDSFLIAADGGEAGSDGGVGGAYGGFGGGSYDSPPVCSSTRGALITSLAGANGGDGPLNGVASANNAHGGQGIIWYNSGNVVESGRGAGKNNASTNGVVLIHY